MQSHHIILQRVPYSDILHSNEQRENNDARQTPKIILFCTTQEELVHHSSEQNPGQQLHDFLPWIHTQRSALDIVKRC